MDVSLYVIDIECDKHLPNTIPRPLYRYGLHTVLGIYESNIDKIIFTAYFIVYAIRWNYEIAKSKLYQAI